jgi:hypothetical protein
MARFIGPHAQDAKFLFGSDRIAVACPAEASAEQVRLHVQELVPNSIVRIDADALR